MNLRRILGICECKGCMKRALFVYEVKIKKKNGDVSTEKMLLCKDHAKKILEIGQLKSVK